MISLYTNKKSNYVRISIISFSILGSYQCRMGWSCSNGVFESKQGPTSSFCQRFGKLKDTSGPGGIVYKNVMAKTRREKGKESELQVCL